MSYTSHYSETKKFADLFAEAITRARRYFLFPENRIHSKAIVSINDDLIENCFVMPLYAIRGEYISSPEEWNVDLPGQFAWIKAKPNESRVAAIKYQVTNPVDETDTRVVKGHDFRRDSSDRPIAFVDEEWRPIADDHSKFYGKLYYIVFGA